MERKNNREIGSLEEQSAADFLVERGYEIVERNYRCRFAEIDLVAREDGYLCFVEVKYRESDRFGAPEGVVSPGKMRKISLGARFYMAEHHLLEDTPVRFDVVLIVGEDISLIRNAFDYQGR